MRHKIPCFCDNTFTVDVPETIDLDAEAHYIEDILAGNFMNFSCASCGKRHKPEFPLTVLWPSKSLSLEVLPELERGEFYRRGEKQKDAKAQVPKAQVPTETVIGYPEMAERISVLNDNLSPEAEEAVKYMLLLKADENYPEQDISVWYQRLEGEDLVFHVHGIRAGEVAVMKIPRALYEKTLADYKSNPKAEPFSSLRWKSYLSVQNLLRPDMLK